MRLVAQRRRLTRPTTSCRPDKARERCPPAFALRSFNSRRKSLTYGGAGHPVQPRIAHFPRRIGKSQVVEVNPRFNLRVKRQRFTVQSVLRRPQFTMAVAVFNGNDSRHNAVKQTDLRLNLSAGSGDPHRIAMCQPIMFSVQRI